MDLDQESEELSQPTRAKLLDVLSELRRPASTIELAEELGRHPNGIRKHLERMRDAGLLMKERQLRGRGRPRDLWSVDPNARPGGNRPTAYSDLSRWLAQTIEDGRLDPAGIEAKAHEIGLGLMADDSVDNDPVARFRAALAAMGFQPSFEEGNRSDMLVCLNNCPYRDAAREQQTLICALHKGVTSGLLESIDETAELTRFEPHDPDQAGCQVEVRWSATNPRG